MALSPNMINRTLHESSAWRYLLKLEDDFSPEIGYKVISPFWSWTIYGAAFYMFSIYILTSWMKARKPISLRTPLIAWNTMLCIFSILGTARTLPRFYSSLRENGMHYTLCNDHFMFGDNVTGLWTVLFGISKYVELIDTLFVILRKQKLIFLQWYHHASVLVFSWLTYADKMAVAQWFCVMNFFVHSFMYGYFALRAMRVKMPGVLPMMITVLQILQMVVGAWVTLGAYQEFLKGSTCSITQRTAIGGLVIYGSYFILFAHVFYTKYFLEKRSAIKKD